MAAKDLDSGDIKKQELDDVTTCCICTEVYTDPKALPCIHTFCMKCIQDTGHKTKKGPGDEMPCPICRRLFRIPPEGFHGLPTHLFIERLIQMSRVSDQSASSRALCDACADESKEESGKEIPAADTFCVDCHQKFCEECGRQHRKFKLTKNHKMVEIKEHDQYLSTYQAQSVCEMHRQRVLDVFCADCRIVVCAICFIDDHKHHEGSHVDKFVDGFRKQIESNVQAVNECRYIVHIKQAEFLEVQEHTKEKLECDVAKRKDELKQLTDDENEAFPCLMRQSKLKELQMATDDIETYLSCLETYNIYCQKIMDKGSASDICGAFSDLSVRAVDLQQQCQLMIERGIQDFKFCFRKSELEELLDEDYGSLIGEIEEEHKGLLNKAVEQNEAPSSTTLHDLPLEMLDMILQKSYFHWILNLSIKPRDEEVIRCLISVDVCFNRRITRQRFKKAIWRFLKDFYGKTKKRSAIIKNNRNYLLENIQPNIMLISSLLSLNCITEEQRHFIQRQRSKRTKNAELLKIIRSFDETKFSKFVKCLRQANQRTVTRIIENGGGIIKIEVHTRGAKFTTSRETQLRHQKPENLSIRTKSLSPQTNKLIRRLWDDSIEILNSYWDRQTMVVWIWCHSQAALEHIQRLYLSKKLIHGFFEIIQPSVSKVINIDRNQFKKTIVACLISMNFTQRIEIDENEIVQGVTKLRNVIYVLCRSVIHVFEARYPFRLQKKIEIKQIKSPEDIGSSEKENCLYVCDILEKCVWKITKDSDDEHITIIWLTTDYRPTTLSVSSDGQLLMVNVLSSSLMIYGSDAKLIRSIKLPRDTEIPIHAVETSIGNFIILYEWMERERKLGIYELTRDGQMVSCRFIPSNETQELIEPRYLSLDSDDRLFVADYGNGRVILLDSDLKWNRSRCPTKEEQESKIRHPLRLCYDEQKKQLIVGGFLGGVNIYTLNRN